MPAPDPPSPIAAEEIFRTAEALPVAERAAYLDAACEGQPEVRARIERKLEIQGIGAFLQHPPDEAIPPEIEAELARLKPEEGGERIGNYKLLQQIGEGGFGIVWMAEQIEPVRRRVALKIIKLGMDTKEVIARFEQERQALAMMDHPNIAKVLDAGATQYGRPYFVMELVRGIRITEYCDQHNLPTAERLGLFIAVCNAVQHAHQKGVIHRDLKPSNILVTLHDGVPVPKVIDFGVAKATQSQRLTDLTLFTQFEQMIGTPLYMSPEQAEMSGLDIDTRSDIYSLGVLLYELLTGRTPFDPEDLVRKGHDEIRRVIREQEPPKPSTALHTMAIEMRTSIAQHRQSDGAKLINLIRGDLDWVVMKALEKDRTRRYDTAIELATDIQRHLNDEPVLARRPTQFYRFQKLIRRNKPAVAAVAGITAILVLGTIVSTWQATRAARAELRATGEANKSQEVATFLISLLGEGTRVSGQGGARRIISVNDLDAASLATAEKMFREVLLIQKTRFGEKSSEVVQTLNNIAKLQQEQHDMAGADKTLAKILLIQEARFGEISSEVVETLINIASLQQERHDLADADKTLAKVRLIQETRFGKTSSEVVKTLNSIAGLQQERNDLTGADQTLGKAIELVKQRFAGTNSPSDGRLVATTFNNAASLQEVRGDLAAAEATRREGLAVLTRFLGENSSEVIEAFEHLERLMELQGDRAGAVLHRRQRWEKAIETNPTDHFGYYYLTALLAELGDVEAYRKYCVAMLGQFSATEKIVEAERTARSCLLLPLGRPELDAASRLAAFAVERAEPRDRDLAYFEFVNGLAAYRTGQHARALDWIDKCLAHGQVWSRELDASREVIAYAVRAMACHQLKQPTGAEAALERARAILKADGPKDTNQARANLWVDWTTCNVLVREATKLVEEDTTQTKQVR